MTESGSTAELSCAPQIGLGHLVFYVFITLYFCSGLAAYNIGVVPLPWIACLGFIVTTLGCIIVNNRVLLVPGTLIFILLFNWAILINGYNFYEFKNLLPAGATLSYDFFIIARFINLLSFGAAFYLTYWLLNEKQGSILIRSIVIIGVIWSLGAIYMYFANIYDLPNIMRTRIGTGGGEQATTFSTHPLSTVHYFYNRALGTFREPSHLAEYLLMPFLFSFLNAHSLYKLSSFVIGVALLLTVSISGLMSLIIGCLASIILCNPFRRTNRLMMMAGFLFVLIMLASQYIYIGTVDGSTSIYSIVSSRIGDLFESGLQVTGRDYVYNFIEGNSFPWTGYGLGNANILFSNASGSPLITSYLSLYINILFSLGIIGFVILVFFILQPIVFFVVNNWNNKSFKPTILLMAYLACLVSFSALSEELTVNFAVSAAFLFYQGYGETKLFKNNQTDI